MTITKPSPRLELRAEVLAQRSSRGGNDEPLRVDRPRSWILLCALGVIAISLLVFGFVGELPQKVVAPGVLERIGDVTVQSVAEGQVRKINVTEGEQVAAGAAIVELYGANGALTTVTSPYPGRIAQVFTAEGKVISHGDDLFAMVRSDVTGSEQLFAYVFLRSSDVGNVVPGKTVDVSPLGTSKFGVIRGTVEEVNSYPSSTADLGRLLRNSMLADQFVVDSHTFIARIRLEPDAQSPSGVKWSNSDGPTKLLPADTVVTGEILLGSKRPIDLVLGK